MVSDYDIRQQMIQELLLNNLKDLPRKKSYGQKQASRKINALRQEHDKFYYETNCLFCNYPEEYATAQGLCEKCNNSGIVFTNKHGDLVDECKEAKYGHMCACKSCSYNN